MQLELTIKQLKDRLSKFSDGAKVAIIFKNNKNKLVFTDNVEIYSRTQLKGEKLIEDKNLIFFDISNG